MIILVLDVPLKVILGMHGCHVFFHGGTGKEANFICNKRVIGINCILL